MLQYTLLFLEVILLIATAYVYWTTRRLVEESEKSAAAVTPPPPGWVQNQADVTQMAQDVTTLMADLQTVAESARDDVVQKTNHLQHLIDQAESAISELHDLIAKIESGAIVAATQEMQAAMVNEAALVAEEEDYEPLPSIELVYSPSYFGEYLRLSGCGKDVVDLATAHAQEFIFWFTSQFEDDQLPTRIENRHLEDYARHMEAQKHDLDTIKRRYIALKAYINWANNISQSDEPAPPKAAPVQVMPKPTPPAEVEASQRASAMLRSQVTSPKNAAASKPASKTKTEPEESTSNIDRYRAVFALAEQGLDQLAIAARTGLEQEAVRMLLVIGKSAYAGL
jgi:hypothetical protein